jgi:hypothetical protein
MATTFRADLRAGFVTILEAFMAANPTMLRSVHRARPEGFTGDYPIGFVEGFGEVAFHTQAIRDRTMNAASVVVVGEYRLNAEHMDDFDELVDALIEFFTARPHIVSNTIWSRLTVEDYAEEIGDALRPAVRFTFLNVSIQEGRYP